MNFLKVSFCCFQLFVLLNIVSGAMFRTMPQTNPSHPGMCWDSETKTAYAIGQTYSIPDSCSKVTCQSDHSFIGVT